MAILNLLDRLIAKHRLHDGEWPVDLCSLLENFAISYQMLPDFMEAITVRRSRPGFVGMRFSTDLQELPESARKRHAQAHELAHVLLKHRGGYWAMYRAADRLASFDTVLDSIQERQCEMVAAYLLIPFRALHSLHGYSTTEIAGALDVPEHLVELRWVIWGKFGR